MFVRFCVFCGFADFVVLVLCAWWVSSVWVCKVQGEAGPKPSSWFLCYACFFGLVLFVACEFREPPPLTLNLILVLFCFVIFVVGLCFLFRFQLEGKELGP